MASRDDKKAARKAKKEKQKALLEGREFEEAKPEKKEVERAEYHEDAFDADDGDHDLDQFAVSQAGSEQTANIDQDDVIKLDNFSISVGGKTLFQNASVTVAKGRRYGLLGPNGQGKTTLLKHMAQRKIRGISPNISVLLVEQELAFDDDTNVVQAVLRADKKTRALLEEEQKLLAKQEAGDNSDALGARLNEIYEELHITGADSAESRVRRILFGLGFDTTAQLRSTRSFSGGWRMRISLAQALFMEPDLLLLDEPTNHLDLNAVIWLDNYLQKWKKMLLVVSHDQDFLESICTDFLHLEHKKLVHYRGTYYDFKRMHAQREKELMKAWEKQQDSIKAAKKAGLSKKKAEDKAKDDKAKKDKQQQKGKGKKGQEDVDDEIQPDLIERPKEYRVTFDFPTPPEISPPYIEVDQVDFAYGPDKPLIFEKLDFGVGLDTRACVVGPNGSGKSTVIKLLFGHLDPTKGEVRRNRKLRVGMYSQHFQDLLDFEKSPVQYLVDKYDKKYQEVRNKLGKFGLEGHAHTIPIKDLSGGQKARVVFAELSFMEAHVLFFDEPTNHLDIESIDALITAINEFEGGVVCVTHDARLILEAEMQLWVVADKDCAVFEGTFDDYRNDILRQIEEQGTEHINRES